MTDEISKSDLRAPDYFEHLLQACDRILQYTSRITHDQFITDSMVQDAVLRNIEILGEATKNLMECLPDLQSTYPQIPWIDIYGMRNRIAHAYFFINFELVWTVVVENIPELRQQIARVLGELQAEE
ncbi:MAG: DUF86 domain-containing protein [Terracidiphilus sp.]|jgi:uncharacterized protein with HEPN domain